eukprot:351369-Chlamydomonas_euryale.AAC.12
MEKSFISTVMHHGGRTEYAPVEAGHLAHVRAKKRSSRANSCPVPRPLSPHTPSSPPIPPCPTPHPVRPGRHLGPFPLGVTLML